jgi:hypothetical protein
MFIGDRTAITTEPDLLEAPARVALQRAEMIDRLSAAQDGFANALYVVGGQQRLRRSLLDQDQQWYDYQKGVVLRVDTQTGDIERALTYVSPPETCAPGDPILFKSATLRDNKLYACTQTEVLVYELPAFKRIAHISLPIFNDVHHVLPTPDKNLLVAISGLDMVVEMDFCGNLLRAWDVYDGKLWTRFSRFTDYRMGVSTKPHKAHPNHLFMFNDEIWVTRFEQKDAVCLNHPDRRIDIGIERIHDGCLVDGCFYFTTVNGQIVIANAATLKIEEVIDLTTLHDPELLLGWCRGLLVEGTRAWVGFSRIRPTKFREAVGWVRSGFKQSLATHIACYDLVERRCLAEIELEEQSLNAVFSIFSACPGSER